MASYPTHGETGWDTDLKTYIDAVASSSATLTWTGSDYTPTNLKASASPKTFVGPTDPSGVSGVSLNQYDVWIETA